MDRTGVQLVSTAKHACDQRAYIVAHHRLVSRRRTGRVREGVAVKGVSEKAVSFPGNLINQRAVAMMHGE